MTHTLLNLIALLASARAPGARAQKKSRSMKISSRVPKVRPISLSALESTARKRDEQYRSRGDPGGSRRFPPRPRNRG